MLVMLAQSISGLLVARFVAPDEMGVFLSASLVLTYIPFLTLGTNNGLNRQLPFLLGKGEGNTDTNNLINTAWTFTIGSSVLISSVLLIVSFIFYFSGDFKLSLAFLAISFVSFFNLLNVLVETIFRAGGYFLKLSRIKLFVAVAAIVSVPFVYFWGFEGLLIRTIFLGVFYLFFLIKLKPVSLKISFFKPSFKELVKIGFPIFIAGYIYSFFISMDRLLIIQHLGTEQLGYYTPALQIKAGLQILPASIFQVLYPKMCNLYGQTGNPKSLIGLALKPLPFLAIALLPFFILGWFLVDPFVSFVLPNYVKGIPAAQWIVILTYFQCLATHQDVLTTLNKIPAFIVATLAGISLSFFLIPELMSLYSGVEGASMGQAFAILIVNFIMLLFVIYYIYFSKRKNIAQGGH
jgi:O-antigen/teichoic acid export membrane protein